MNTTSTAEVRDGWRMARVSDILKVRNGYAFKSTDYKTEGIPLIRQSDLGDDVVDIADAKRVDPRFLNQLSGFVVRDGDLLIGMSGSLGKIARYQHSEPALQNQRTGLLQVKPGHEPRFAKLVLKFVEPQILAEGKGIAVQNVSASEIENCTFPLPSHDEQRRIVAEIEKQFTRLEAGVAALRRVQANLKRYRAAVLKAACEGKLVPTEAELSRSQPSTKNSQPAYEPASKLLERILAERRKNWTGRGQYKEPAAPDTTNLPPLPESWTWANLDQIASVALGKMLDKAKHQTGKKLRYLRNINVRWGWVDTDDCLEMFFEDEEIERFSVRAGDVLVCEGGEPGRASVWNGCEAGMMYQKAIHRVRFFGQFQARYLVFLLEFMAKTGRLERWFTGSTIKHFTRESFITLPIPLPPLAEQTRIVAEVERRLSVVEELESVVSANLQRATRLRQSILQKAFSGELLPPA